MSTPSLSTASERNGCPQTLPVIIIIIIIVHLSVIIRSRWRSSAEPEGMRGSRVYGARALLRLQDLFRVRPGPR